MLPQPKQNLLWAEEMAGLAVAVHDPESGLFIGDIEGAMFSLSSPLSLWN